MFETTCIGQGPEERKLFKTRRRYFEKKTKKKKNFMSSYYFKEFSYSKDYFQKFQLRFYKKNFIDS